MLKRAVKEDIDEHIERNKTKTNKTNKTNKTKTQHGFRSGKSTTSNLIEFLNVTTGWLDEGINFDVIYLDFAKAFDVVCHRRLLIKLESVGIEGQALAWLKDWMSDRKQRVGIDGYFSEWVDIISSVLQGSVLGGMLFNIYIDDIDDAAHGAMIGKFADDTKLGMKVENPEDARRVQEVLNKIEEWAEDWEMGFNVKKCKVMHHGNSNGEHEYYLKGIKREKVIEEKDLGVWMEKSMKPSKNCEKASNIANRVLGQIARSFHFRKKSNLVPLYKTFVRPKLEYAVAAWSPWLEKDVALLEKIQERMIRMLSDVKGKSYEERLKDVGLTTLKERRKRGDLIEAFKVLKGINRADKNEWFCIRDNTNAKATRSTTSVSEEGEVRREDVLFMKHVRLETRKNFFNIRVIKEWNALPDMIRNQKTVNAFKNKLDKWTEQENNKQILIQDKQIKTSME